MKKDPLDISKWWDEARLLNAELSFLLKYGDKSDMKIMKRINQIKRRLRKIVSTVKILNVLKLWEDKSGISTTTVLQDYYDKYNMSLLNDEDKVREVLRNDSWRGINKHLVYERRTYSNINPTNIYLPINLDESKFIESANLLLLMLLTNAGSTHTRRGYVMMSDESYLSGKKFAYITRNTSSGINIAMMYMYLEMLGILEVTQLPEFHFKDELDSTGRKKNRYNTCYIVQLSDDFVHLYDKANRDLLRGCLQQDYITTSTAFSSVINSNLDRIFNSEIGIMNMVMGSASLGVTEDVVESVLRGFNNIDPTNPIDLVIKGEGNRDQFNIAQSLCFPNPLLTTHFVVDEYGNRFHNFITRLNKTVRSKIVDRTSGEKYVEIDIRSSQPLLLALTINRKFNNSANDLVNMILEHDFYQEYANVIDVEHSDFSVEGNRKHVKKNSFYPVAYGTNKNKHRKFHEFLSHYIDPTEYNNVVNWLEEMRLADSITEGDKVMKKNALPRILQNEESSIFLHGDDSILNRIYHKIHLGEMEHFTVATVHDSILVPESKVDFVRQIMIEVYLDRYGINIGRGLH